MNDVISLLTVVTAVSSEEIYMYLTYIDRSQRVVLMVGAIYGDTVVCRDSFVVVSCKVAHRTVVPAMNDVISHLTVVTAASSVDCRNATQSACHDKVLIVCYLCIYYN